MKPINNYLDKYYTNKFLEEIYPLFILRGLKPKYIRKKIGVLIQLKPIAYKDEYYKSYYEVAYTRGLYHFIKQEEFLKDFDKYKKDFMGQF